MARPVTLQGFGKAYLAILLTFVTSRLLLQTDLLMIAPFGAAAGAAFAVPGKLMIIDAIVAFALGPAIAVAVGWETAPLARIALIRQALGLTLALSLLLTVTGLLLYPRLLPLLVSDPAIRLLARPALWWMTLTIPLRMLVFIGTLCLFSLNQGGRVARLALATLLLNALLDALLIYGLGMGFTGAYQATAAVALLEAVVTLGWLARECGGLPLGGFNRRWLAAMARKSGWEWLRLVFWQLEGVATLAILAAPAVGAARFSTCVISSELFALLAMPLVALMRCTSLHTSGHDSAASAWSALGVVRRNGMCIALAATLLLWLGTEPIGRHLYQLDSERLDWWTRLLHWQALILPVWVYGYLLRGCLQGQACFARLALVDIGCGWLIGLPLLALALQLDSPVLLGISLLGREVLVCALLGVRTERSTHPGG